MTQGHSIQQDAPVLNGRQMCFFAAFLIPASKLLAVPALLSYFAKGDLLLPALGHYLLQAGVLAAILFLASRSDRGFFGLISDNLGKTAARIVYGLYAVYFVFSALQPLLDLERFVYTAFFDTAPPMCIFCAFFLLSGFICTKNLKAFGRSADISMPLFLISFVGLMILSVGTADFTNLLPVFGTPFRSTATGFLETLGHFSDTALLLPLLDAYRYRKGDAKKIMLSYGGGAGFVLFFLAVFYGIFGPIAPRQEFAFVKTAQYFPALSVVGRFDLLLIYLMTIVLLFYYSFVLQSAVLCFTRAIGTKKQLPVSAVLNGLLFVYTLLFAKHYNALYYAISLRLFWVFLLFADVIPLLCLFLRRKKGTGNAGTSGHSGNEPPQALNKEQAQKQKPGIGALPAKETGTAGKTSAKAEISVSAKPDGGKNGLEEASHAQ